MPEETEIRSDLTRFFAYKAEWLKENIFSLFTEPHYLNKLPVDTPCMLVGGRGTGKTTVLRGLSYQGQFALTDVKKHPVSDWSHFGFYLRIDTNRVSAFSGPEVPENRWQKLLAHYLNLLFCDLVFEFLDWYEEQTGNVVDLDDGILKRFTISLCVGEADRLSIRDSIADGIVRFESYINNIGEADAAQISMQAAPVDLLFAALTKTQTFASAKFSFLLDEYENLTESQQQVVNTLLKHASGAYTFKIGIREEGWRCRTTVNANEQLQSPADYRLINIEEELEADFPKFAAAVCDARLDALRENYADIPESVNKLFPSLGLHEEATLLGVDSAVKKINGEVSDLSGTAGNFFAELSPLEKYFIKFRSEGDGIDLTDAIELAAKETSFKTNFDNYSHALLYTIRRGKRGIRKYYCGWSVLSLLAHANLRYLIELVDHSISDHLKSGRALSEPIAPDVQTKVGQRIGKKNLAELEGLTIHGAKLTKLLLGLGRVFGIMAEDAAGHTPEVNQFNVTDDTIPQDVADLLSHGVMHLALVRLTGTKIAGLDTKDYDYAIHPIFAPYFVFSHRKKRKMKVTAKELLDLINGGKSSRDRILAKSKRTESTPLPDQLTLFEKFFDGHP